MKKNLSILLFLIAFFIAGSYYISLSVNTTIDNFLDEENPKYYIPDDSRNWKENYYVGRDVYVIPYIGDIDGEISKDWFYFLNFLVQFYEEEKIPISFSFYPTTIDNDPDFLKQFMKMYDSEYIELMQKEFIDRELEKEIESLNENFIIKLRKNIILEERNYFRTVMENQGIENVEMPISYTQLGGRISEADRKALEESGIKMYFDVYYNDEIGAINSTDTFDVIQYGVGFTRDGNAGSNTFFRTPQEVIKSLQNYSREDVEILTINDIPVIPIWAHQQDFESRSKNDKLEIVKWKIYTETILRLKNDPNVKFITPNDVYNLRRNSGEVLKLN